MIDHLCVHVYGNCFQPDRSCQLFFFFQAEDGIRDLTVTGVQTCALPIFRPRSPAPPGSPGPGSSTPPTPAGGPTRRPRALASSLGPPYHGAPAQKLMSTPPEIGRASCRERV